MSRERSDVAFLWDMLDSARAIQEFTRGMNEGGYHSDPKTQAAVERKIEIIGEASRRVSEAFKDDHPEIPWKKIVGQRHHLTHEYWEIEDPLIWEVVTRHIPELIEKLEPLVPLPPNETD